MQAKDKPKTVFSNELKVLERAEQILKNPELTREKLTEEYNWLTQQYHQLLNDAVKITRIGDINQKKLFESHEEIERQKEVLYQLSITDHHVDYQSGDMIYLLSDGITDQQDQDNQKFGSTQLEGLLNEIGQYDVPRQHEELVGRLENHQGDENQRDDITLVGVRLS